MYYCKKCGAVVTGKYCSCCGKRATTDLEDFRNAQRRIWRAFDRRVQERDSRKYNLAVVIQAATLAHCLAEDRVLPKAHMTLDSFHLVSDACWKALDSIPMCAETYYERIMETCYPGYKEVLHERSQGI